MEGFLFLAQHVGDKGRVGLLRASEAETNHAGHKHAAPARDS